MRFVSGSEAAVVRDSLIISDLHLGAESGLWERGIRIGGLTDFLAQKTISLLKKTGCRKLVVLGDVKENVISAGACVQEYFSVLSRFAEITVCKGNHDGNIERVHGISRVAGPEGIVLHGVGLFHGHAWPAPEIMRCKTILMGHNHPQLTFFEGGKKEPRPVWMVCPSSGEGFQEKYPSSNPSARLVLMPSFNPLLGNDIERFGGLGPVFRKKLFKWNTAIVYTLHGTRLGTVDEITRR